MSRLIQIYGNSDLEYQNNQPLRKLANLPMGTFSRTQLEAFGYVNNQARQIRFLADAEPYEVDFTLYDDDAGVGGIQVNDVKIIMN